MKPRRRCDPQERFASYLVVREGTACNDWTSGVDKDGYPLFWYEGRTRRAARLVWASARKNERAPARSGEGA